MVSFLCECLPRGGSISLTAFDEAGDRFDLSAEGEGANVPNDVRAALDPDVQEGDLTSKSVVAHVAAVNAHRFGLQFSVLEETGRVKVEINFT